MTEIKLSDGYYIEIDPLNFALKQRYAGRSKDGAEKEGIRIYGYYPTLQSALKRFCDLIRIDDMRDASVSLDEYINALDKADSRVIEFLSGLEVRHENT